MGCNSCDLRLDIFPSIDQACRRYRLAECDAGLAGYLPVKNHLVDYLQEFSELLALRLV